MNEKFNKNAKVEQLTKMFYAMRKKKALLLKILSLDRSDEVHISIEDVQY